MTNNQAEYIGLLAGVVAAKRVGVESLKILGDSQLVVRQASDSLGDTYLHACKAKSYVGVIRLSGQSVLWTNSCPYSAVVLFDCLHGHTRYTM